MRVPILQQGRYLIASLQPEMTDSDWSDLRDRLLDMVGDERTLGTVVDVSGMDIMDSFAGRTLGNLAQMLGLRGALTVVVGIQPAVAFAMVQLGIRLDNVQTALDLDGGLQLLRGATEKSGGS